MYAYGRALLAGEPIGRDDRRAYSLFSKAASKGNVRALFWQAICLHDGRGVRADATRATELLKKASARGLIEARDAMKIMSRV
jgi:TPR repeat protein